MNNLQIPIFPKDLMRILNIKHSNTLRIQINNGKVPPPDVKLSAKTRYWHKESLIKAGLIHG